MAQSRLDLQAYPQRTIQPSKLAISEKIARDTAAFLARATICVVPLPAPRPYLETPRKPFPEWEAAKERRGKERAKAEKSPTLYSQVEAMELFGCPRTSDGYQKLDRLIARGEVPPPDEIRSVGRERFTKRWNRKSLDAFLQLRKIVDKHAESSS